MVAALSVCLLLFQFVCVWSLLEVLRKEINFIGKTFRVPYNSFPLLQKNITTLFITEQSKLRFVLNAAISISKFSGGVSAFTLLCLDCSPETSATWREKGLFVIEASSLRDISQFAFRLDGPMPYDAVLEAGDKRRHSVHMFYREWVKHIMLENGLSVFLADVDMSFYTPIPMFTYTEDIILESLWPFKFRPGEYTLPFVQGTHNQYVQLNNGVALFTASEPVIRFQRRFMGALVHEIVANFGFAQTAFMKLMNMYGLQLHVVTDKGRFKRDLVGATTNSSFTPAVTLRGCHLYHYAVHPMGFANWNRKEQKVREAKAWYLPDSGENWFLRSLNFSDILLNISSGN
jgi:hypothetical protein